MRLLNFAFIINSAPGVGKSTLMNRLHSLLPNGFAIIDGDDFGRVTPYTNNISWLNVMQDNIVDCCNNFKNYGYHNCIIGFVFPTKERLERIRNLLREYNFKVVHIILSCDDKELKNRITKRNTSKIISVEKATQLERLLKELTSDYRIDTTNLYPNEVIEIVKSCILEEISK